MNKPINVLTLTSCYPVAHSPSDGIFVRSQCEALQAAGAAVTVLAPRPWTPPGFQWLSAKWRTYRNTPTRYELNGIPVYRPRHLAFPRADLWMPVHWQYVRAAHKTLSAPPDIIHAHFAYPGGVAGVELARRWNIPLVLTLHGDDVNVHPARYPRLRRALVAGATQADLVIAVSEALAGRTAELTGCRPMVAPIGVNLDVFAPRLSRQEARHALGLPAEAKVILHLGRLVEEKGIVDLLTALATFPNDRCLGLFVGQGPLATVVRATPGCTVAGVQPNERVPLYMLAADLFVLPSYSEGMPTVLIEAGAIGLPVVATAVGGIPELLTGGRGWLVPPKNSAALAEAMRSALSTPGEATRRALRLRQFVQDKYNVQRNAHHLLAMYQLLAATHRPTPPEDFAPLKKSYLCT